MTENEYALFLSFGACLSALGAVLNLLNLRRRGSRALLLSVAFLAFAAVLRLIKIRADQLYVGMLGAFIFLLLVADVFLKARQKEQPR